MNQSENLVCAIGDGWKVSRHGEVLNVDTMEFVHPTLGSYIADRDLAIRYAKAYLEKTELSSMYSCC